MNSSTGMQKKYRSNLQSTNSKRTAVTTAAGNRPYTGADEA